VPKGVRSFVVPSVRNRELARARIFFVFLQTKDAFTGDVFGTLLGVPKLHTEFIEDLEMARDKGLHGYAYPDWMKHPKVRSDFSQRPFIAARNVL